MASDQRQRPHGRDGRMDARRQFRYCGANATRARDRASRRPLLSSRNEGDGHTGAMKTAKRRQRAVDVLVVSLAIGASACATPVLAGPAAAPRPTARTVSVCCTALERGVLDELNRARMNPARFAAELEA